MSDLNLKSFNPLYPMRIHQYDELLNDQNQNVMDKINSIIDYLNQVGKLTNDVVKDWNTVYQYVMGMSGSTLNRPTANLYVGVSYFDIDLGKPIYCKQFTPSIIWVDSTGTTV
jgi:hypothetical protein